MAGGFRINGKKMDNEGGGHAETPSLVLIMSKDEITFNKSSAEMRPAEECRQKVASMRHLDVCSSHFSQSRAVETLARQNGERIICDLLLDQELLPGVGNIIKNEALIDARIRPDAKLSELTEEHLNILVKVTRDFSMLFYKCRKTGKPLEVHLKIYRKGKCKLCGGKCVTTRMGVDNPRLTSYCPACQDNDLSHFKGKFSNKNNLLGWFKKVETSEAARDWSCEMCTLINKPSSLNCTVCLTARNKTQKQPIKDKDNTNIKREVASPVSCSKSPTSPQTRGQKRWINSQKEDLNLPSLPSLEIPQDFTEPTAKRLCTITNNVKTEMPKQKLAPLKTILPKSNVRNPNFSANSGSQRTSVSQKNSTGAANKTSSQNMTANNQGNKTTNRNPSQGSQNSNHSVPSAKKYCPTHKAPCVVRTVFKNNHNKGRMYLSCPAGKCNFFKWADEDFPYCDGHGKKCVLRIVYKEGPNNARRFFACAQPKNKQCGTFHWADQYNDVTVR